MVPKTHRKNPGPMFKEKLAAKDKEIDILKREIEETRSANGRLSVNFLRMRRVLMAVNQLNAIPKEYNLSDVRYIVMKEMETVEAEAKVADSKTAAALGGRVVDTGTPEDWKLRKSRS